jgi:hypothetical protein
MLCIAEDVTLAIEDAIDDIVEILEDIDFLIEDTEDLPAFVAIVSLSQKLEFLLCLWQIQLTFQILPTLDSSTLQILTTVLQMKPSLEKTKS